MLDMRRREFVSLLGGAAAWPLAASAQQTTQIRRVGVLMGIAENDPGAPGRIVSIERPLRELGWVLGRNIELLYRWGAGDTDLTRAYAKELIEVQPDVILAHTNTGMAALHREASTVPIVFVMVSDPVGMQYVDNMARPGRNVTGFTPFEPSLGGKWLSLLKEIAPNVEHIGPCFNPEAGNNAFPFMRSIAAAAPALGIKSIVAPSRDSAEIERMISAQSQVPNSGLIFLPDAFTSAHRERIVALIARHRMPATYPLRIFSAAGGLISYGVEVNQLFREAVVYVDRVLRGTPPGDLPVQAPTKFELVINLKTAKSLGLEVPPSLLARADEVIE
jgi:putative tryptophan/tyrosine transport system substrate-binding protein